jgi:hypothetical protein
MTAAPVPGSVTSPGRMPGGLARVLARATRPPVAVPSADAGAPRPVVHPAPLDQGDAGTRWAVEPRAVPVPLSPTAADAADAADRVPVSADRSPLPPDPPRPKGVRDPAAPAPRLPAPDVEVVFEEHPVAARTAPPANPPVAGPGLEPQEVPPVGSRPPAAPSAGPAAEPPPAATASPTPAEPPPDPPALGRVADSSEPSAVAVHPTSPRTSPASRPAPEGRPEPARRDTAAPTPAAPPVVIGRIEVHVDPPTAPSDPFAGCRVVAAGLTARRGGAW